MKKVIPVLLIFTAIIFVLLGCRNGKVYAEDASGMPFTVEPVLPSNQDKDIENYISVSTNTHSISQELRYKVRNTTDTTQVIDVNILNAYTSANGVIEYKAKETKDNKIIDQDYEFRSYAEAPDSITLESGQTRVVSVNVQVDKQEGTLLGAVSFQSEGGKENANQEGISLEVTNQINSVYGVAINFPTDNTQHDFRVGEAFLDTMPSYYVFRLPITLNSPILLQDIDLAYEVDLEGKQLFSSETSFDFAPMTKTNFAIPYEYEELLKDKPYTLKGEVTYTDQNGEKQVQQFEKVIEYKDEKAGLRALLTTLKIPVEKNGTTYWVLPFFLICIPLIIFLIFFLYRRKKKKEEEEDKNENEEKTEEII
jgi:cbb3-type cytochrome oxidase subunit 3